MRKEREKLDYVGCYSKPYASCMRFLKANGMEEIKPVADGEARWKMTIKLPDDMYSVLLKNDGESIIFLVFLKESNKLVAQVVSMYENGRGIQTFTFFTRYQVKEVREKPELNNKGELITPTVSTVMVVDSDNNDDVVRVFGTALFNDYNEIISLIVEAEVWLNSQVPNWRDVRAYR